MKGKLIFRVPHLFQWSRLLWCRGRKKLWVQKKGSEGKARLTSCRESDRIRMHWFKLKVVEAVIQKPQSMHGRKFKYQRAFVFVQMWWRVNVSCFNSFVFINEDHRFLQSRMLSTFHHMVLAPTCFAPLPPLRTGVFPAKRYLWPRKLGIIILNSRGLPFPFCIWCCPAGSIRISIPRDWDLCLMCMLR